MSLFGNSQIHWKLNRLIYKYTGTLDTGTLDARYTNIGVEFLDLQVLRICNNFLKSVAVILQCRISCIYRSQDYNLAGFRKSLCKQRKLIFKGWQNRLPITLGHNSLLQQSTLPKIFKRNFLNDIYRLGGYYHSSQIYCNHLV